MRDYLGVSIALGAALGVAIGSAGHHMAVDLALGVAIGVAIGAGLNSCRPETPLTPRSTKIDLIPTEPD